MIDLFILIFCSFIIANQIAVYSKNYSSVLVAVKKNFIIKLLWILLVLLLILFSGLRTSYNDTTAYTHAFNILDMNSIGINTLFKSYGGFDIYQYILKKYISTDSQVLIMASSIITNTIFLWFFSKYSKHFGWTILAYFIFGPYVFSMAGMKQILAMSLSLFAIDNLLKENYFKFVVWILLAMTFHPYIICLLVLPLFRDNVWDKKVVMCIIAFIFFALFLDKFLTIIGFIGKNYSLNEFTENTINPIRVIVEDIPLVLSFMYRKKINSSHSKLFVLGMNMMILNGVLISLGLFVNPIYFGRIGTYFAEINAVIVPVMLCTIFKDNFYLIHYVMLYYLFYFIYFVLDLTKLGSISIFTDVFKHISLF